MSRTISSPLHLALVAFIIATRRAAGFTQSDIAKKLGRHQSFVATVESGQRRIDVVDLFDFANAIGFDPVEAIKSLQRQQVR
jgi:transcriptional regulator with XRE-family HTH domain